MNLASVDAGDLVRLSGTFEPVDLGDALVNAVNVSVARLTPGGQVDADALPATLTGKSWSAKWTPGKPGVWLVVASAYVGVVKVAEHKGTVRAS